MTITTAKTLSGFLRKIGKTATLKKKDTVVYNDYDEVDYDNTTYTETTIEIWLDPAQGYEQERPREGVDVGPTEKEVITLDTTADFGDLLVIDNETYEIIKKTRVTYRGLDFIKLTIKERVMT